MSTRFSELSSIARICRDHKTVPCSLSTSESKQYLPSFNYVLILENNYNNTRISIKNRDNCPVFLSWRKWLLVVHLKWRLWRQPATHFLIPQLRRQISIYSDVHSQCAKGHRAKAPLLARRARANDGRYRPDGLCAFFTVSVTRYTSHMVSAALCA